MTIKHLRVDYDKVNPTGSFSPGDVLSGRITVVTSKETRVQCLLVEAEGKAEVTRPGEDGHPPTTRRDRKRYFYFENIILQDKKGDGSEIIGRGKNVYSFTFEIPNRDMPSSYEGKWGKITYSLHTKLTRSIWLVHKSKTEFPFLTKSEFPFVSKSKRIIIGLKEPQYTTRILFLGSGKVTVNVSSEKMGLKQGEAMEVRAEVLNHSRCAVTPKFHLSEKQTFVSGSRRVVHTNDVAFGAETSVVPEGSVQTVARTLSVPPLLPPTFFNCSMMGLQYELKVTLDFPQARNCEIKLPLVILKRPSKPPEQKTKTSNWFEN